MNKQQLLTPELLEVKAPHGGIYMGGSQEWFCDSWKRMSGCGPTTASGMLWYLARSRQTNALWVTDRADKSSFLKLMDTMFDYITPSGMGVSAGAFTNGVARYSEFCGVRLRTRALKIRPVLFKRPSREALCNFILESLSEDLPIAFLNLSNGSVRNLNGWHWVMIIAFNPDSMTATICDYGGTKEIDVGEWLQTTILGGGFVSVYL